MTFAYLLRDSLIRGLWGRINESQARFVKDIINSENKIAYLQTVVKYIDGVIKSIDNRGWDIKNAITWKQFEAGMM